MSSFSASSFFSSVALVAATAAAAPKLNPVDAEVPNEKPLLALLSVVEPNEKPLVAEGLSAAGAPKENPVDAGLESDEAPEELPNEKPVLISVLEVDPKVKVDSFLGGSSLAFSLGGDWVEGPNLKPVEGDLSVEDEPNVKVAEGGLAS